MLLLLLLLLLVARVELRSLGVAPQLTKKEQMVSHPPRGGGTPHMKVVGMLIGNFE